MVAALSCCRQQATGTALPILILTASDAVKDRVAGLNVGANDYLIRNKARLRRPGGVLGMTLEADNVRNTITLLS